MNELTFMECDTCRGKSGIPVLCTGCLHNRAVITQLFSKSETVRKKTKRTFESITNYMISLMIGKPLPTDTMIGKPLPADTCINCWETPGIDVNCGGGLEICRYCNGTGKKMRRERKLNSDFSLLQDSQTWRDPGNYLARAAFARQMFGREYGYEALHDAWNWFIIGWTEHVAASS